MSEERLAALIRAEVQRLNTEQSPWVDMRGLAEYLSWGFNTVKRLSARNLLPGKVKHEGKVRFHKPTIDAWLLSEHAEGQFLLPHEDRDFAA